MRKKHIFTCIALLCVLAVACVIFAACDPAEQPESGFKVTLEFDNNKGSVTLSKPAEGELYDADEEVTVTVTPNEGWLLDVFTVSGFNDATLNGGGYTFKIQADTTVTATFTPTATTVLKSLQGGIIFEGSFIEYDYYYNPEDPDVKPHDLKITYDTKHNAVLTEDYSGLEPIRVWLYQGDKDDNIIKITHNQQGAVQRAAYSIEDEETGEKIGFSNLFNPFDLLTADALTRLDDHKWTVEDASTRYDIANTLLGYAYASMDYFELYEEDGMITKIKFAFERVTDLDWWEDFQYFYDLDVKEQGTASIDDSYFNDYTMTEAHDELKTAMESAAQATSYSVKYETEASSYTLYYCEEGVYIDEKDNERGYTLRPDGYIWSYYHYPEDQLFEFNMPVCDDLSLLKALFEFKDNNGEYYKLLKDMGDGRFEVRTADAYDSYGDVPIFFAKQLASGEEQIEDFSYTFTFAITIKDGKPYQAELDIEGEPVKLTFGDWDDVSLPVQITSDVLNGNIDSAYNGYWASENGDIVLNINLDKLLFADESVDDFASLNDGGYSFTYNNKSYTLIKNGETLTLTEGSTSTTLYNCPWYMYIGDFYQNNADVTIRANSIKVKFKGSNEQTATAIKFALVYLLDEYGYGDYGYQFNFKLGNDDYIIQQYGYDYDRLIIAKVGNEADSLGLYRDKYEELDNWDEYVGTYSGEGYTAKLENDKLTITYNDNSEQATELVFYRDWDYDYSRYYYQFAFKYGATDCVIEVVDDHTMLLVIDAKGDGTQAYLVDESYVPDYSPYYGVYEAYDYDDNYQVTGVAYRIELSEDGMFIAVNGGQSSQVTISSFSEDSYGANFTVKAADGTVYYISIWPSYGSGSLQNGTESYSIFPVSDDGE